MKNPKDIFIRNKDCLQKIELDEVYFFTKKNNKVIAVLKNNYLELSTSLYNLTELIASNNNFFRCHKSFIININKISNINKFNNKTYNINFKDIKDKAYITQKNLKILTEKIYVL